MEEGPAQQYRRLAEHLHCAVFPEFVSAPSLQSSFGIRAKHLSHLLPGLPGQGKQRVGFRVARCREHPYQHSALGAHQHSVDGVCYLIVSMARMGFQAVQGEAGQTDPQTGCPIGSTSPSRAHAAQGGTQG